MGEWLAALGEVTGRDIQQLMKNMETFLRGNKHPIESYEHFNLRMAWCKLTVTQMKNLTFKNVSWIAYSHTSSRTGDQSPGLWIPDPQITDLVENNLRKKSKIQN